MRSGDAVEEALPEVGAARNIAQRFRQMESESRSPGHSRGQKEFTPPPGDSGIFESQPEEFQVKKQNKEEQVLRRAAEETAPYS